MGETDGLKTVSAFLVAHQAVYSKDYRPWKIELGSIDLESHCITLLKSSRPIRSEY